MELVSFLLDFILHIDRHLAELVAVYGPWIYLILFLIVFCETGLVVTPFLPGDSLLFVAGTLALYLVISEHPCELRAHGIRDGCMSVDAREQVRADVSGLPYQDVHVLCELNGIAIRMERPFQRFPACGCRAAGI